MKKIDAARPRKIAGAFAALAVSTALVTPAAAELSFGFSANGGVEKFDLGRGAGNWPGSWEASEAKSSTTLDLKTTTLGLSMLFDNGGSLGFEVGKIVSGEGVVYGGNGNPSHLLTGGDGSVLSASTKLPVGGGFSVVGEASHYDFTANSFDTLGNWGSGDGLVCVDNVSTGDTSRDSCKFTNEFTVGRVGVQYSAAVAGGVQLNAEAGLMVVNGYNKLETWNAGTDSYNVSNSAPLFDKSAYFSVAAAYDMGPATVSASLSKNGNAAPSIGLSVSSSTGEQAATTAAMGNFFVGGYVGRNTIKAEQDIAWYTDEVYDLDPVEPGAFSVTYQTRGVVFGVQGENGVTAQIAFGKVSSASAEIYAADWSVDDPDLPRWALTDGEGTSIAASMSGDILTFGNSSLRAAASLDYAEVDFTSFEAVQSRNNWDEATVVHGQVASAAVGIEYQAAVAPELAVYAGLDYLVEGGRYIFDDNQENYSNYVAHMETGSQLRLGLRGSVGAVVYGVEGKRAVGQDPSISATFGYKF